MEDYEAKPSPEAWAKLNGELNKNRNKELIWWTSIAASIVIIIAVAWMAINFSAEDQLPTNNGLAVQEQTTTTPEEKRIKTIELVEQEKVAELNNNVSKAIEENGLLKSSTPTEKQQKTLESVTAERLVKKQQVTQKSNDNTAPIGDSMDEQIENVNTVPEIVQMDEMVAKNDTIEQKALITNTEETTGKSVKLVYTLPQVVKADSSILEENKKTSPFNKMVTIARNITESEKGLGNLREAKDNLLSFKKN
jgi:hypothetical protein